MNDVIAIQEFEIDLMKLESVLDTVYETYDAETEYAMLITESTSDVSKYDELIYEADSKFTDKVKKVIDALIEAFKNMMEKLKEEYRKMVVKNELKKRVKALEKKWNNYNKGVKPLIGKKQYDRATKEVKIVCKEFASLLQGLAGCTIDISNAKTEAALDRAANKLDIWGDENDGKLNAYSQMINGYYFKSVDQAIKGVDKEMDEIDNILAELSNDATKKMIAIKTAAAKIAEDDELKAQKVAGLERGLKLLSGYYAQFSKSVLNRPFMLIKEIESALK